MIKIDKLSRNFGEIKAVDEISFCIQDKEIVGFLGPNGAGKTTTLRMIVGYLQPGSGNIEIDGESIFTDPLKASRQIGYLPEQNPLYEEMTVVELLAYFAALRKLKRDYFRERLNFVVKNCGLKEVLNQRIGTLSKGYRQRTGLAQAILHDPKILILDEPTSGLDPNQIIEIRELIRELGKEKMVLLSSHIMQEVQALCDRVVIINKGKIIVDDTIENLPHYLNRSTMLILEVQGENIDFSDFTTKYPFVELKILFRDKTSCKISVDETSGRLMSSSTTEQNSHKIGVDETSGRLMSSSTTEQNSHKIGVDETSGFDLRKEISSFIRDKGWLILEFSTSKMSLESIFHELTIENFYEQEIEEKLSPEQEFIEEEQTKPEEVNSIEEEQ
ncbi:MAG TPA: ATP-binding cassette domain-containing protein [Candidatus Cloacimonas sp.]|mgnify:FL=1|jgi:ABC-2 type transport system ATP-binding protein|nr:ATP-binding cassette domain-containing protein [Candidatus Cloacimonas sp.]